MSMKLDIKAKELLDSFHFLSRIARRNENIGKNLLIESGEDEVKLYAQSTDIYGVSVVHAGVTEPGNYLLPLSIIPYLQNLGENQIKLDIDLDKICIRFGRSRINLAQISGRVGDFSKRTEEPEWIGTDLVRLKDIKYASSNEFGYDVFWIMNGAIVASNRIKIAVYKPDNLPLAKFVIPSYVTSFMPSSGIIDIAFGKEIWFGDARNNISLPVKSDGMFPQPLVDLSADVDFSNFVIVNLANILQLASNASRVATDKHPGCVIDIADDVAMTVKSDIGDTDLHVNIMDNSGLTSPIKINVNAEYLKQILTNCNGPQVMMGVRVFGTMSLFMVHDYNVTHYLVPRVGG